MLRFKQKRDFSKTEKYLKKLQKNRYMEILLRYGVKGVEALSLATPKDTGLTAASWTFDVVEENGRVKLVFYNSNIQNGVNIAIILQYGHGTRNGGYVVGTDYINPAIKPVFDDLVKQIEKEVTS